MACLLCDSMPHLLIIFIDQADTVKSSSWNTFYRAKEMAYYGFLGAFCRQMPRE